MSPEVMHPQPEQEPFHFHEHERLFERISHKRFMQLIEDQATTILQAEFSTNSFGEFLFATVQRNNDEKIYNLTFWGLGYHEARERWLIDEWYWYQSAAQPSSIEHPIDLDELKALIHDRVDEITPDLSHATQTRRGQLFEMLADLTDEDGALTELEDLEDLLGDDYSDL